MSEGKIATFYSYKGGTGRTMALANVGWILASNGKRVLVVDWDLDSPGLHKYLHPFVPRAQVVATPGVIELINDYMWAATQPGHRRPDWHRAYAQILPQATSVTWSKFPDAGTLDFVSAGQQNVDYSSAVTAINWDQFFDRYGGGQFFDALREDMKQNYDYTLIDSRTGLSDIADICTVHLPDILVDCFTLSDQSIEGSAAVARNVRERYHDRNIRVLPVPMRIDDSEKSRVEVGLARARQQFNGLPDGLTMSDADQYWSAVEIPYKAFYAYEEMLAVFGDRPGSPRSLLSAFERLTGAITEGEVKSLGPMSEDTRLEYQQAYTRRVPLSPGEVFVSYVPEDRTWADWVSGVLTRAGLRVRPLDSVASVGASAREEAARAAEAATRIVALVSPAYTRSPQANGVWETMARIDPAGTSKRLIPVRVDESPMRGPMVERVSLDLTRRDEEQAVNEMLRLFGPLVRPLDREADAVPLGVRYPRTAPPVWRVPGRNAAFSGRHTVLEELRGKLRDTGQAVVLPVALYGLGGVGKSQLALEYAHRYMADYDVVWWIPAEQRDLISAVFARLADPLDIRTGESLTDAVSDVREALRRGKPYRRWLLIFDNADDPAQLAEFLPGGKDGHVLVTSRNSDWSRSAAPLEINVFSRDESKELLQRWVPTLSDEEADLVADKLGDLPLAVDQAGAWLKDTGESAKDYVERLERQLSSSTGLEEDLGDFPNAVLATWRLSFGRLRDRSPAAARLLEICSFFAPEPIPLKLLYNDKMLEWLAPYDEASRLRDQVQLRLLVRDITSLSLAKIDQGTKALQVHRLIQAAIRAQIPSRAEREDTMHVVHDVLTSARPDGSVDDPRYWSGYDGLWLHLTPSEAEDCDFEPTRQLLIDRVRYLGARGDNAAALEAGNRLKDRWTEKAGLGPHHRQTLAVRFQIGNALRALGRFEDALVLDTETLALQREELGDEHPHTLQTAGSVAGDLRGLGRFSQALDMDQETYRRFVEVLGEDDPATLSAANNLAVDLRFVGHTQEALRLDRETYARRIQVLGEDHPYTLHSGTMLARDMREMGDYSGSFDLLRNFYQSFAAVLGEDALDTLRTAKSLAVSLRKAGRLEEAHSLTKDTNQRYLANGASESPNGLSCELNLACELSAMDKKQEAYEVASKVLKAYQNILGRDHPFALITQNNITTYVRHIWVKTSALDLAEQTLRAFTGALGDNHPYTLACAVNTANCLREVERLGPAEELLRETLARLRERLGAFHPDTLVCEANLAVILREQGRHREAEEGQQQVIAAMVSELGDGHPNITALRNWQLQSRDLEVPPT